MVINPSKKVKTVQLQVKICNIFFSTKSVTDEKFILFQLLLIKCTTYTSVKLNL